MKEMIIGKPRLLCFIFVLATMVGLGCFGGDGGGSSDHHCIDADGDGRGMYCMQGSDKDDSNPNVWTESGTCVDLDGDSYFAGCDAYVTVSYDCDDTKTSVHPGAMEIACGEALDNDCDGNVDESETVTFVDPNLESEVRTKISKATGIIISTDMCAIKMFWPSLDINDLTGLEYAYAMTDLRLIGSGPEICAFQMHYHPPLFMLAELSGSEPLDISHLSGLINLTNLEITAEHISDISPLSGLTNLTSLGLNCNNISDISPLSGMSMLRHIFLINNQITDTLTLKTLTNLQNVYLQGNALTAVPELSTMSNLLLLDLSHNYISDISNLSKLSKPGYLTYLYLNNNQIADISVLTIESRKIA